MLDIDDFRKKIKENRDLWVLTQEKLELAFLFPMKTENSYTYQNHY